MAETKKEMLLIDGHGLAFRGFYALPETLCAPDGTPTNATLGFFNMLFKALDEWKPNAVGIFFDAKGRTKRHEMFDQYKEGRRPAPEAFKIQLPIIEELCRLFGFSVVVRPGVEADDCIASTAKEGENNGYYVRILSADKDLFQTIRENVSVVRPSRGVTDFGIYDEKNFKEKYGFAPPLMADYLSLVGDAADNIPGVPGVGDKTAKELVASFGSLEEIYGNLGNIAPARRAKLEKNKDAAFASKALILPQETPPAPAEELFVKEPEYEKLRGICDKLGLKKLTERFLKEEENASSQKTVGAENMEIASEKTARRSKGEDVPLDELLSERELAIAPLDARSGLFALASRSGRRADFHFEDESEREKFAAWAKEGTLTLFGARELLSDVCGFPLPASRDVRDVEVANYLLHPDRGGIKGVERALGYALPAGRELASRLFDIYAEFEPGLEKYNLRKITEEIDVPLCAVLAKMGRAGIYASREKLSALDGELAESIAKTEVSIAQYVGESINLASPKQVGKLLFEKLKLPPAKKTQTGYSTDASVLEELSRLPEPMSYVPKMICSFREESKVRGSFVQPFLKLSELGDGAIHSTFDHLATGTGRLASRDPNVQNMPVYGVWADKFRECFTPRRENFVFVAADYSQIELRVLADVTGEEKLIDAFQRGVDVHLETASWVFGLPPEDITPEQRRFAKTVNFGLLYGMSAFGLSSRLGVPRKAAAAIVERYFAALPKVRDYIKESAQEAKSRGYTRSLFGRIRPMSEVSTVEGRGNNPLDRVAVNTPIQSAAADIGKIALLRFDAALSEKFPSAFTVLQIHDSIVCECAEADAPGVTRLLTDTMEAVGGLKVPLKAEVKRGVSLKDV